MCRILKNSELRETQTERGNSRGERNKKVRFSETYTPEYAQFSPTQAEINTQRTKSTQSQLKLPSNHHGHPVNKNGRERDNDTRETRRTTLQKLSTFCCEELSGLKLPRAVRAVRRGAARRKTWPLRVKLRQHARRGSIYG